MALIKSREYRAAEQDLRKISALEEELQKLSDSELKNKTEYFKTRLSDGESEEDIKIEAFAVAREATNRVLKKRLFDVQILGGLIIHNGTIAEMKTGEGKTITSIPPVYLNALSGKGVWVSTVNEYLTQRDAEETGRVHSFLGLTVGINLKDLNTDEKRKAYECDITYSMHSEIGFDYLRDNMVKRMSEKTQRSFNFCMIDEVDSILIDEARTPLIITGGKKSSSKQYEVSNKFVQSLKVDDHYEIDWESKSVQLTDAGSDKANEFFGFKNFYDIQNSELVHRIQNALRANYIMQKDIEYIVSAKNEILLVDAFTGRIMEGRSYSDGLHQAIQAREKVEIEPETQTMATVTYQNLFRMFKKLSGMTGTAKTEESEFIDIYNTRVQEIPTNKLLIRVDHPDEIYVSKASKYKAIVVDVGARFEKGQPILLGTEEVSESERISKLLKIAGIPHTVLNAKQNESEAEIISKAGKFKAITIATNMAGRGTDIVIDDESRAVGGLYVIGTNKAESRRIDNQLRGRSGRQGDIGESKFFLSLDDNLIKRFSNQSKLLKSFESYGDRLISGKLIQKYMNRAQKRIEGFNFDIRKNVLQYDDVVRQQRELIYSQRDIIISQEDLIVVIVRMLNSVVGDLVEFPQFKNNDSTLNIEKFTTSLNSVWCMHVDFKFKPETLIGFTKDELIAKVYNDAKEIYELLRVRMFESITEHSTHSVERQILLTTFDQNWQMHIDMMAKLRSSSSLAHYAQKNPYQVFVEKGTVLFRELLKRISHNSVRLLMQNKYATDQKKENASKDPKQIGIQMAIQNAIQKAKEEIKANGGVIKNIDIVRKKPQQAPADPAPKIEKLIPVKKVVTPKAPTQIKPQAPTKPLAVKKATPAKPTAIKKATPAKTAAIKKPMAKKATPAKTAAIKKPTAKKATPAKPTPTKKPAIKK